jgi:uncharacterized protein (TIGR02271 family)
MAGPNQEYGDFRATPLSQLPDFEVADDSPDVRGWDVVASDQREIGTIDDLLVDTSQMQARYLVVDLKDGKIAGREDSRVLVPAGSTRVDEDGHKVHIGIASAGIATLPSYSGAVTDEFDREHYASTAASPLEGRRDEGEQRITRSAEELRYGRREVPVGEVNVRKHVETEHVKEPVTRSREDVRVERRPISGDQPGRADFGDDEIRIPLTEEEVVVEKRPVAKEEVVITKERTEDTVIIEEDLRKGKD